jgi:magnesium transporter
MNRGVPQGGRMTAVGASEQQLNVQVLEYGSLSWVNIERPGVAEMEYRKDRFSFHQLSLDDCLSVVQLPKLDEFDDHVFLVLHFPMFSREFRITRPSEVDVFAGANYIVTVHAGNLRPLTKLFDDCFPILNKLIAKVNETEERVFDAWGQKVVREMAELRRDILSYRRLVRPQIELLEAMEVRQFQFLKVDQDIYFGDLADHVRRIWSELEDRKDVVESLYDSHGSLATLRTNDIIRMLTVAATVVMQVLLVASLYGMNVDLSLADEGISFWMLMLVMGLVSATMLVLFRLRRWL